MGYAPYEATIAPDERQDLLPQRRPSAAIPRSSEISGFNTICSLPISLVDLVLADLAKYGYL